MGFPTIREYETLVYDLPSRYPQIHESTLVLATLGATFARLEGRVVFGGGLVFDVWELIDFSEGRIRNYSYELSKDGERLWWCDPFEHPEKPELAASFPHHRHVPPDLRHNRVLAPGIGFDHPNLPQLVEQIVSEHLT